MDESARTQDHGAKKFAMTKTRTIAWTLALVLILGCGWWKARENGLDQRAQDAWQAKIDRLIEESQKEFSQLVKWRNEVQSDPNAQLLFERKLNDGESFAYEDEGNLQSAEWTHPVYGIHLWMTFEENRLVGSGASLGAIPDQPRPPRFASTSRAENVRKTITQWAGWLWLAILPLAIFGRRYALLASEILLLISMVWGTAWLVNPHYDLTARGVFSNDPLFFAALMYVASISLTAWCAARRDVEMFGSRFRLRSLMALLGIVAVATVLAPFIAVSVAVLMAGAFLYSLEFQLWRRTKRRVRGDVKTSTSHREHLMTTP